MRAVVAVLSVALAGCFDFSSLTECRGASDLLVCDDFEAGGPGSAWAPFAKGDGTGIVDGAHTRDGSSALHVTVTTLGSEYVLQWRDIPQTTGTDLFVRAYLYFPALPDGGTGLFTMIEAGAPFAGGRVILDDTGELTLHDEVTGENAPQNPTLVAGRWTCLEWELLEANAGHMNLWIDDELGASYEGDTLPATKIASVNVGAVYQNGTPTRSFEVWLDDVVIDDARITCRQ
jgi:hypothetical protein